jgi:hypothetical protein
MGKKEFVNTALKTITKYCLFNYITLRLQKDTPMHGWNDGSTVCCLLEQCPGVHAPRMFTALTFNLNLIPLF